MSDAHDTAIGLLVDSWKREVKKAERERGEALALRDEYWSLWDAALVERDDWKAKYEHAYETYVELNNGEFAQACEDRDAARVEVQTLREALKKIRQRTVDSVYDALSLLEAVDDVDQIARDALASGEEET